MKILALRRLTPVPITELPDGAYHGNATGRVVEIMLGEVRYQAISEHPIKSGVCRVIVEYGTAWVEDIA